jgi:hypothetical protein
MEAVSLRRSSPQLALVLSLVLSACVSAADGPSPTDPLSVTTTTTIARTTTTVTLAEGLDNYEACLADRGISIGEIELDGLGRPRMARAMAGLNFGDPEVLQALNECGPQLSTGALDLAPDPVLQDLVQSSLEELAACLRRQGVADYPDPTPDFTGLGSPFPMDRIPWTDPDLEGAVSECGSRLEGLSP